MTDVPRDAVEAEGDAPATFVLVRDEDETGISGTGCVAWGCVFPDGRAVLRWASERRSTAVYDWLDDLEAIHGHGGKTRIVWVSARPHERAEAAVEAMRAEYAEAVALLRALMEPFPSGPLKGLLTRPTDGAWGDARAFLARIDREADT